MTRTAEAIGRWIRQGHDSLAVTLRRAATSALGTYGAYVGYGLLHPALRRPTDGVLAEQPLAGDELLEQADSAKTFAIAIHAPPCAVWPYLVQMGYGRGGWYGWYPMENGGRGSAPHVLREWQDLALGDLIPDGPRAAEGLGVWRVVDLVPERLLVLYSRRVAVTGREVARGAEVREPTIECSWTFALEPTWTGSRLIVRVRVHFLAVDDGLLGRLTRRLFDVGDTVMENTMLAGIKRRAEADFDDLAATSPADCN